MTNPNSDGSVETKAFSAGFAAELQLAPKQADLKELQKWIDHSSWDPLGRTHDVQACWELLGGDVEGFQASLLDESPPTPRVEATEANSSLPDSPTRFVPQASLGVGAFGVVLQVHDRRLQRATALKILRPSLGRPLNLVNRFIREARAVAAMEHPNIVRVYESGMVNGQPFITLELVNGPDLAKYLKSLPGRMPVRQAVWLLREVAGAVQFAHNRGVLHRDLKPSNILLAQGEPEQSEGLGVTPRLTDFGLAKRIDIDSDNLTPMDDDLTGTRQILGTVRYMSPEQASGRLADVAIASDIFSLGVILFELLTGELPFQGPSDADIMLRICYEPPSRPRKLVPNLPKELEAVLLKTLAKDPSQRYATADELRHDLTCYLNGEPVSAAKYSHLRLLSHQLRRQPLVTSAIAITILTILTTTALVTRAWLGERQALQDLVDVQQRERTAWADKELAENAALYALNDIFFTTAEKLNNSEPISHDERIQLLKDALKFHEQFVRDEPLDVGKRHRLSLAYHHLGNALTTAGRWKEATDARLQTLHILDKLLVERPGHAKLLFQKSVALYNLSKLWVYDDKPASRQCGLQAQTILEGLVAADSSDPDIAEVLIGVRLHMVASEEDLNRIPQMLQQVIDDSVALFEANPTKPRYAKHAIYSAGILVDHFLKVGPPETALQYVHTASTFFEKAFASCRTEEWVHSIERIMVRRHAWCQLRLRKWSELAMTARRGQILEQTEDINESLLYTSAYKIIYRRMEAIALQQLGRPDVAATLLQEALALDKDYPHSRQILDYEMAQLTKYAPTEVE